LKGLCFPVATPDTQDPGMLALRGDLATSFSVLAELGYAGAELMVRDVRELPVREIARMARDYGLVIPAVSTGQCRKEDGLQLCSPDSTLRRRSVDRVREVLDFAAELEALVNIGTLRGTLPDRSLGVESLVELLAHSPKIAVEPQCKWVSNWIQTVDEALELIGECGGLSILFDVYHAELEEASVPAAMVRAGEKISWVQFSDSNRKAPGWGHWNFGEYERMLSAVGYQGYVSVECLPWPSAAEAAAQAMQWLVPRGLYACPPSRAALAAPDRQPE